MQTVKHYSELGDDPVIIMNKWYLIKRLWQAGSLAASKQSCYWEHGLETGTDVAEEEVEVCQLTEMWKQAKQFNQAEIPPKSYRRITVCKNSADFPPA